VPNCPFGAGFLRLDAVERVASPTLRGRYAWRARPLRKWALTLNGALAGRGIYAGHVAIGTWIAGTPGAPEGALLTEPDDIARLYWDLYTGREPAEHLISA
jgi:hypothetical protein